MSYGWSRDQTHPSQPNAADLANSFLNTVGQELQGSADNCYGHESQRHYGEYRGGDEYRRRDERDMDRGRRHQSSRDRYPDRSRDNRDRDRRRRSRDRRERSPRQHRREERDYRRRRRSISPRRQSSRRSGSPVRRREDENIVPLSKRPKRLQNWDMAPAGMEGMTAQQVKMTGLFPLPGQVVGTRTPQSFQPPPVNNRFDELRGAAAINTTATKQAKRLYVGQIPLSLEETPLAEFFNATMYQLQMKDTTPVAAVQINHEKNYAFVEFQTAEQATACMAFDGVMFQGQQLKIRRPKDYQPPVEGDISMQLPGLVSTNVPDTPNKIFIGGLPIYLNDDQVIELLRSFGELRAFNLVKDVATGANKGFAFCEYEDPNVTDLACQGLHNMELGDRKLIVQRASVGAKHIPPDYMSGPILPANYVPVIGAKEEDATRVLQLMNMITPEELEDEEEYQDIWEDIAEECAKFGNMVDMKIPKPQKEQEVPGLGLIFVRYETKDETLAALHALAGRKFADRTVVATFVDEQNYLEDKF
ncbi:unnamed protein product [Rhizopus stolonifer]